MTALDKNFNLATSVTKGLNSQVPMDDSGVEWLGKVPKHWRVLPIKRIVETPITDGPHETPRLYDEGVPFVSAEAVSSGRIDFSRIRGYISAEDNARYSEKYSPKLNDIYMVKSGATTGVTAIVDERTDFNIWSPLAAIRCGKMAVPRFVLYYMRSRAFQDGVELNWNYGTQQNIGMGVIENLHCILPPLDEQKAIATFLDRETRRIDGLVEKQQKLIELLEAKRASLISQAVTKGLDPNAPMKDSGVEWLGEVPQHWGIKRLKFVIEGGLKYGANESAEGEDREQPRFIRITDIDQAGNLRDETFKSLPQDIAQPYMLQEGDVLFARTGATVGKSFMYSSRWGEACYAGYLIRARLRKSECLPKWLGYFCKTPGYWAHIFGSQIQATIQNVSAEKYADLLLPLPPINEQEQIAETLDAQTQDYDTLVSKAEQALDKLSEYRTSLISAAVTGKIDVQNHPSAAPLN